MGLIYGGSPKEIQAWCKEERMQDLVVWLIHTPAGVVALLSAIAAFVYPKGSSIHRRVGKYFTISMLIMLVSGGVAGYLKESPDDVFLSLVVFYAVFTAWLTVFHKKGDTGLYEYVALAWIVVLGIVAFNIDPAKVRAPDIYPFWVGLAAFFAIGDIRNLYQRGLSGSQRIARHVWRMSFSLIWAALAFGDKIIKMLDSTIEQMPYVVAAPALLVLVLMLYWLHRVIFSRKPFLM